MLIHRDVLVDQLVDLAVDPLGQLPSGQPSKTDDEEDPKKETCDQREDNPFVEVTLGGSHIV